FFKGRDADAITAAFQEYMGRKLRRETRTSVLERLVTFPWTLRYDEMDYVLSGRLDIRIGGETVSAGPGELIYIPQNSSIQFSVTGHARFLYFVYPADWQSQGG
ncbi:cupin domain-containing protein, partial [Flavonifractor plautii]|uniref:cupin domain-containing protein n=1 Tax=Flavonifractor plautii TaxID=292800 RepID=UPI00210BB600